MAEASQSRIRAFAAIELSSDVRDGLAALIDRLRSLPTRVSWIRAENLHLTLRFLGDVDPNLTSKFADGMRETLAQLAPFRATVGGLDAFPSARRPNVLWSAVKTESASLDEIYGITEQAARSLGLAAEGREIRPHVTVGRVRGDRGSGELSERIAAERDFVAGAMTVEAVSLFSSELTPQGARYTRLHRLTLDGLRGARDL